MNGTTANLTLKQRRKMQGVAMPEKGEAAPNELSKRTSYTIFTVALGIGIILGLLYFKADARAVELANEEALLREARDDMSPEVAQGLNERVDDLRSQLPNHHFDPRAGRLSGFFAMSSADQLARLKRRAEGEKRIEKWQAEQGQQNQANGDSSQSSRGNGGRGGGGRGRGNDTQRQEGMEQRLAQRPPQQRGQMGLYSQMKTAVRQQMTNH